MQLIRTLALFAIVWFVGAALIFSVGSVLGAEALIGPLSAIWFVVSVGVAAFAYTRGALS